MGFSVQLYVNAVRKMPLMRNPWEHAIWAGAGAAVGSWIVSLEKETEKELTGQMKMVDVMRISQLLVNTAQKGSWCTLSLPMMQTC